MVPSVGTFFYTNPMRVIGSNEWSLPCGFGLGFNYHEVAWKGNCGFTDPVFDACLLVNGSPNPGFPPYVPLLPANLTFADALTAGYRFRLVTLPAQLTCVPAPILRQRRLVT
jgi:hypothetical protein